MNLNPELASQLSTPIGLVIVPIGLIGAWAARVVMRTLNNWLTRHDQQRAYEQWVRDTQAFLRAQRAATTHDAAAGNEPRP